MDKIFLLVKNRIIIDLFGVGIKNENSHISTIDVSGVALKGVKALIDENEIQKQQLKDQSDLIN